MCVKYTCIYILYHVMCYFLGEPSQRKSACILGDPTGDHVVVEGNYYLDVKAKESACSTAANLALKLMDVFFTKEEIAQGSCTEVKGVPLLNPEIIDGIRSELSVAKKVHFLGK